MPSPPRLEVLAQPFGDRTLGEVLDAELREGDWETFRAVVAFLKRSGFRHLAAPLDSFLDKVDSEVVIAVGIDHDGTSLEGLQDLWRLMYNRGELFVFKEGQGGPSRTFHPKVYLFERGEEALALISSGNLTAGGLFINHELTVSITLDLRHAESAAFCTELRNEIDGWQRPGPACRRVDASLLQALVEEGELISEATIAAGARAARTRARRGSAVHTAGRPVLFSSSGAVRLAPVPPPLPPMAAPAVTPPPRPTPAGATRRRARLAAAAAAGAGLRTLHQMLLIEVRPRPNGEVFLSKLALNDDPGFFGFPFSGWTTPKKRTNPPYPMATPDPQVEIVVYDSRGSPAVRVGHSLNLVYYTRKDDIRITIPPEPLARIPQMSLLVMTRNPTSSYDYRLEFYPPNCNTPLVRRLRSGLTQVLPGGGAAQRRRYGWM